MDADPIICAHCGHPIEPGKEVYPYANTDKPTHPWCASDAACEEVVDTFNAKGTIGLEQLDEQREILKDLDESEEDD